MANLLQHDIAKLDEEIRLLECRIASLRSARNSLIPVGQLPLELLEKIFNIARSQGTDTIHLSWVSHAWRVLALERKTLWTLITNSNLRWISIYLERSSPAPLAVHFEESFEQEDLFSMIMEQLPRIKQLTLPVNDDWVFDIDPIIENAFTQHGPSPLPHLDLIRLATEGEIKQDMLPSLQNVRHLSFRCCIITWEALPPFPYLRSLAISSPEEGIELATLFDVLENMPNLELLVLANALGDGSEEAHLVTRRSFANGPNLSSLSLAGGTFEINMALLQAAGFITHQTDVSFQWKVHSGDEEIVEVLTTFNRWAYSMGYTQGITHLSLDNSGSCAIIAEYVTRAIGANGRKGCIHLEVGIYSRIAIVPILSQHLPLQNLHSLWIATPAALGWQHIVDAFGSLPQLQHLAISTNQSAEPLLDLMTSTSVKYPQQIDDDGPYLPPFPALRTLLFSSNSPHKKRLHALLQSRKLHGLRLQTLGLSEDRHVHNFKELAGEVIADFADEVVNMGDKEDIMKQEHYQFLECMPDPEELDIDLDISRLVIDL